MCRRVQWFQWCSVFCFFLHSGISVDMKSCAWAARFISKCDLCFPLTHCASWCHGTWSSLVQVMACHLFSSKPLPEPMPFYCHLANINEAWIKIYWLSVEKIYQNMLSGEWQPFCCSGLNILIEAKWCIYASLNWVIIGSDNGLSPVRRQAIIWTNAGILLFGPRNKLHWNFNWN